MVQNIGWAVKQMWDGQKVRRSGWNGKGMFIILVPGEVVDVSLRPDSRYAKAISDLTVNLDPHVDMYTTKGTMQPGWICSQADLLAIDWEIAE